MFNRWIIYYLISFIFNYFQYIYIYIYLFIYLYKNICLFTFYEK
ncbi:MAG: hypothetical protein N7Q72_07145 [Spiroplasma sp. Tabriz.8]|nr:hypothetical protein [Spiroplasma sp. Tabriz.8]